MLTAGIKNKLNASATNFFAETICRFWRGVTMWRSAASFPIGGKSLQNFIRNSAGVQTPVHLQLLHICYNIENQIAIRLWWTVMSFLFGQSSYRNQSSLPSNKRDQSCNVIMVQNFSNVQSYRTLHRMKWRIRSVFPESTSTPAHQQSFEYWLSINVGIICIYWWMVLTPIV